MLKKVLILIVFSMQSVAFSAPIVQLKDFTIDAVSAKQMNVTYKGEKVVIEKVNGREFKINGQNFQYLNTDTLEMLETKMKRAYMTSKKKTALMDELFIPRAHAAMATIPWILAGFTGLFGFAIGKSTCENSNGGSGTAAAGTTTTVPVDEAPITTATPMVQ